MVEASRRTVVGLALAVAFIVQFQKISIPPPRKVVGNSEGEGGIRG